MTTQDSSASNTAPLMAYFGQHKSGSTWLNRITMSLCKKAGIPAAQFSKRSDFDHDLGQYVAQRGIRCVAWNNAEWELVKDLNFRAFHVVRDPRDVLVSAYYSHLKTHPTKDWPQLAQFRPFVEKAEMEDALFMEIGFIPDVFRRFREWNLDDPRVMNLRLEDISPDPVNKLRKAYQFIGLFDAGVTEDQFLEVMEEHQFEKLSGGRKQGEESTNSHYRKGIAGDWQNHFNKRHCNYFKRAMNDILVKYGYEQDENWRIDPLTRLRRAVQRMRKSG
jgi:hypothetical protein